MSNVSNGNTADIENLLVSNDVKCNLNINDGASA